MTWLTDNLESFINANAGQSVKWYAAQFGCSEPTVRKVLKHGSQPRKKHKPRASNKAYELWLKKLGKVLVQRENCATDWENWFDWKDMFDRQLTVMQALKEAQIL